MSPTCTLCETIISHWTSVLCSVPLVQQKYCDKLGMLVLRSPLGSIEYHNMPGHVLEYQGTKLKRNLEHL